MKERKVSHDARQTVHEVIDGVLRSGQIARLELYAKLSERLGRPYHAGQLLSLREADDILTFLWDVKHEIRLAGKVDKPW